MTRGRTFVALLAALTLVFVMTPTNAWATDGFANYRYFANRLSPQYKFTRPNSNAGACFYRIRFGNIGNVAYAQMRFYNSACGGTKLVLDAAGSNRSLGVGQNGSTGGTDACGAYIEAQATSPPGYIARGMYFMTPYGYYINYYAAPFGNGMDDPVRYCG
jgi:hypothetical protein